MGCGTANRENGQADAEGAVREAHSLSLQGLRPSVLIPAESSCQPLQGKDDGWGPMRLLLLLALLLAGCQSGDDGPDLVVKTSSGQRLLVEEGSVQLEDRRIAQRVNLESLKAEIAWAKKNVDFNERDGIPVDFWQKDLEGDQARLAAAEALIQSEKEHGVLYRVARFAPIVEGPNGASQTLPVVTAYCVRDSIPGVAENLAQFKISQGQLNSQDPREVLVAKICRRWTTTP
ncbi:MAG: hypothetical protein DCO99_01595 [Synechococcus sp. XM-24]|nr:MAG: hypothetical protein DCO99_01595 [Synechococcus sp. XM-24]